MKKTLKLIFSLLIILILAASCKNQKKAGNPPAYYYDVLKIKADLTSSSMRSIYNPEVFDELEQDILKRKVSRTDCYYRLRRILNTFHVAHIYFLPLEPDPVALPVVFYYFGNEYHVVSAIKKYEKYIGWKVIKISGLEPVEAIDKIADYYSYETVVAKKHFIEKLVPFDDYKYAGLLDKNGKLRVILESPEGKTEELRLKAVDTRKNKFINITPEKENNCLPHYEKVNYSINPCPDKRTLYVPYLSCITREDYPADVWFSDIIKELNSGLYDTLVFDLRYNRGGAQITWGFPEKYKDELNKYNIALIASGRTFSAATIFMESILNVCPDAKIFGEETGQAIHNYTGLVFDELKALKCKFCFPAFLDEITPLTLIKERTDEYYRGIMPDVEVQESFEDFMNGEDSIYNAIYKYFANNKDIKD